jgi:dihydroorotate dehydrogenase electron transfer subunit
MRYFDAKVTENRALGNGYFALHLGGCGALSHSRPGQFVMLRGEWGRDPLLPRPMSLMGVEADRAVLLAKGVGRGTRLLESTQTGSRVSVLGPLGNGFPAPSRAVLDLLVAGGVGMPPLYMQAEHAIRNGLGSHCEMLYGGRSSGDLLFLDPMRAMGLSCHLSTEDGSLGAQGRVTNLLEARIEHHQRAGSAGPLRILACGPKAMLWAVARIAERHAIECYLSLEEHMACGIGVCLGCAVPTRSRPYRYTCSDGPVFLASDLVLPTASDGPSGEVR